MKKINSKIIGLTAFSSLFFTKACLAADTITNEMKDSLGNVELPGLESSGGIETVIGNIINVFLSVLGIIFMGLMIYGGYKWLIAQGREEEVKKAKEIIKDSIVGLGIILIAYLVTYFVVYMFTKASYAG